MVFTRITSCSIQVFQNRTSGSISAFDIRNLVTKTFPVVNINYEDAKRGLVAAARAHSESIVQALLTRHRNDCDKVIDEFEQIKERAEKEPDDTEELIEIQNYIKQVKGKTTAWLTD